MTLTQLVYANTTPRAGSRAKAAHHTEHGARKELPFTKVYTDGKPFAFEAGQEVRVRDRNHLMYDRRGVISKPYMGVPNRYTVHFPWMDTAILMFMEPQLEAVATKLVPTNLISAKVKTKMITDRYRIRAALAFSTYRVDTAALVDLMHSPAAHISLEQLREARCLRNSWRVWRAFAELNRRHAQDVPENEIYRRSWLHEHIRARLARKSQEQAKIAVLEPILEAIA